MSEAEDLQAQGPVKLLLSRGFVTRTLTVSAAVLVGLDIVSLADVLVRHAPFDHLHKIFYLDIENNPPAFFSSCLWLIAAFAAALNAWAARHSGSRNFGAWSFIGLTLLFLSADEAISIHERIVDPIVQASDWLPGVWFVPYLLVSPFLLFFFIPFLRRLPSPIGVRLLSSALVFCTGAMGFEMVGGWLYGRHGMVSWFYQGSVVVEESLEMGGVIFCIDTLMLHLRCGFGSLQVTV